MTFAEHLETLGWTQAEFARVLTFLAQHASPFDEERADLERTTRRWVAGDRHPEIGIWASLNLLQRMTDAQREKIRKDANSL